MSDKNELIKSSVSGDLAISSMDDLARLSAMLCKSGFFSDCRDASQSGVKILAGLELGIPAFSAMTGIHIVKGKPVIGGSLMAACVKRSHKYNYKIKEHNAEKCVLEFFEHGESMGEASYSIAEAKGAQLTSNPSWNKYPKNMLFNRAISNGIKWFCPDLFLGAPVYTPEEMGAVVDENDNIVDGDVIEKKPAASDDAGIDDVVFRPEDNRKFVEISQEEYEQSFCDDDDSGDSGSDKTEQANARIEETKTYYPLFAKIQSAKNKKELEKAGAEIKSAKELLPDDKLERLKDEYKLKLSQLQG